MIVLLLAARCVFSGEWNADLRDLIELLAASWSFSSLWKREKIEIRQAKPNFKNTLVLVDLLGVVV